jgi:hypothetical protein
MGIKRTYYTQTISLLDVAAEVQRQVLAVEPELQKCNVVSCRISAGLPHSDYGQTIEIEFSDRGKDATNFPAFKSSHRESLIMGN